MLEYLNAKAKYEGMIQQVRDDVDSKIEQSNRIVDGRTDKFGRIQPATMKVDDRQVYVISGSVVMNEDGSSVDREKSSDFIVIRDAETGVLETTSPENILRVDDTIDAEQQKAELAEQIRQQVATEKSKAIDGVLSFSQGDVYPVMGENGPMNITIVANENGVVDNGDGTVNVTIDGTTVMPMPKEQIQAMSEQANMARVMESQAQTVAEEESKPAYAKDDDVPFMVDGSTVRGTITADANADGLYEAYTEVPVNGKKVQLMTAEQIDSLSKGVQQEAAMTEEQPTVEAPSSETVETVFDGQPAEMVDLDYETMPVGDTLADLNKDFDPDEVDAYIAAKKKEYADARKKAEKKAPKMGTSKVAYLQAKKKYQDELAAIEQKARYWDEVTTELKNMRTPLGQEVTDTVMSNEEPLNGHELAAMLLGTGAIKLLYDDYRKRTGFSNEDAKAMVGLFASAEKGGVGVERAGEELMSYAKAEGLNFFDDSDPTAGTNAILDVLSECRTKGELNSYIRRARETAAQKEIEAAQAEYEQFVSANFGMTVPEYEAYLQYVEQKIIESALSEEDYNNFMSAIYDDIVDEIEEYNEQQRIISEGFAGSEILQNEPSVHAERVGETETGSSEINGDGNIEDGFTSGQKQEAEQSIDFDGHRFGSKEELDAYKEHKANGSRLEDKVEKVLGDIRHPYIFVVRSVNDLVLLKEHGISDAIFNSLKRALEDGSACAEYNLRTKEIYLFSDNENLRKEVNLKGTLIHEIFHWYVDTGVMTRGEVHTMYEEAKRHIIPSFLEELRQNVSSQEEFEEEIVAHLISYLIESN